MTVTIGRRELLVALGGAAAAWPLAARAQQLAMPVVGFLSTRTAADSANAVAAFYSGMKEIGFVDGQNVRVEHTGSATNMTDCLNWLLKWFALAWRSLRQ